MANCGPALELPTGCVAAGSVGVVLAGVGAGAGWLLATGPALLGAGDGLVGSGDGLFAAGPGLAGTGPGLLVGGKAGNGSDAADGP
jgi:hypothetical protein